MARTDSGNGNGTDSDSPAPGVTISERPLLFEIAWEVCAQVGGIYTVLRSKAPTMVSRWGDDYCLIGPYREASARIELETLAPPEPIQDVLRELELAGVRAHFGRWLVSGRPQVLLFELGSLAPRLGEIKYYLWHDNGIGSPDGDYEFDETTLFGEAVTLFLRTLARRLPQQPLLAHFHEWQAAAAIPRMRHLGIPVATVFTTHATLAGRNISAANMNLYEDMAHINAGEIAFRHGFGHRHALEGAAAQSADVFTTVSGITGLEAKYFLGRKPEVLLPNGLNVEKFAAPHEFQVLHRANKEMIHEFVMGHFFPSYTFDLDRTLYVFTAGRYEYRNKGLDIFIDSLAELNRRMRAENSPVTVVAFIVTKAPVRSLNVETLNRQAMYNELRETCERVKDDMGRRLFATVSRGRLPNIDDLIDEPTSVRLKRMMYAWWASPPPTIVTHDLIDDAHDPVLCHLRARRLLNLADDRVKVVFHPDFLSPTSPLLAMEYDQFLRGCHIGLFPSYYEPWGYTPMECVVSGIPAITSDLSGFGDYVMTHFPDYESQGMFVAQRRNVSFANTVQQVAGWLHGLTRLSRRDRIGLRNRVEAHGEHFDWEHLGRHYDDAHRLALARRYPSAPANTAEGGPVKAARSGGRAATHSTASRPRPARRKTARRPQP